MKKTTKILLYCASGIIVLLYAAFLFVLPNVIDISQYKSDIQQIVKEQAKLDLDYENMKLVTTPYLAVGFKADNLSISMPDKSEIFRADSIRTAVSIPQLLLLTVKVSCLDIENPLVNIEILENGEDYKIVKHIENILNEQKAATFAQKPVEPEEGFQFNPNWIRIIIPHAKLNNYKVLITDLATKHYLDLHSDKLIFGYFNGKRIKLKTNAQLYSDKNQNVTANIDINTFLPAPAPQLDKEDDPAEKIDIIFVNPVTTYQNYDLKTNIEAKLRINSNRRGEISSFGHVNIENLTMRISKIQLPESYLRIKTFGQNIDIDTNIYTAKDENLNLLGKINYSKHPKTDMSIKTGTIRFANLMTLAQAFLESLQIPNELHQYKIEGTFDANCYIKTNFKKLTSNGFIKIQNGGLEVRNLGKIISKMNINILLENNILDIANSTLFIKDSPVKIDGSIDQKSYTDVNISTDKLPLPVLFNAFAPKELRNAYNLKSGDLSLIFNLKGKMKEAIADVNLSLKNLDFADKLNTFNIKNNSLSSHFNYAAKTENLAGEIVNNGLKLIFPKTSSSITLPEAEVNIQNKNVSIKQNIIKFNDKSTIVYSGNIINYEKLENIDISSQGEIRTDDLIKFIGKEFKPYINSKGVIPIKLTLNGDKNKQTLFAQALADGQNYITPVDISSLQDAKTSLQATVDFKPNRIKIKDTGLFTLISSYDEEGQEIITKNKVIDIDGTIAQETINLLKVDIPKTLEGKIFVFPKSKFLLNNAKLYAYGQAASPLFRGDLKIQDVVIPEISTILNLIELKFKGDELHFNLEDIMLVNSDITLKGKYSLIPSAIANIRDLDISSKFLNVDDITEVSNKAMKYVPAGNNNAAASADIPVDARGTIDMKRILTGNIELLNTKSNLAIEHNTLALQKLSTNIFKGNVLGDIYINLISMLIDTDLRGSNINVEKALLDSANMKDSLSGTASFNAKLLIDGAAATPEAQMAGIKGDVDFNVKNGQFGPFGKIENLILAENIRESQFFQTALGGIINSLATIDTTHFSELKGKIKLDKGICNIDHITSEGNVMNVHILGKFDLLKNYADMKVRIKITSIISNLLGPINAINPVNLMNSTASLNVVTAKAFSLFCEAVPEEEMSVMPNFSNAYVDSSATKFQLGVRGDAAKPLTLIKSFKWMATQSQFNQAQEFANSLPDPIEGSQATNIEEAIKEAQALEAEKQTLKYKIRHLFDRKESAKEDKQETAVTEETEEQEKN